MSERSFLILAHTGRPASILAAAAVALELNRLGGTAVVLDSQHPAVTAESDVEVK
jgi:alkanesulfonate monooxygenase SsuD/methylene tetrahydromethanopterin reductase-like flavin-dependent oxidoreductase (luciferase family)